MAARASIPATVLAALNDGRQVEPFSARPGGYGLAEAYRDLAGLRALRISAGARPVGRKIGFTNRNIWEEYGVYGPIWGDVYDETLTEVRPGDIVRTGHLPEPRIEPEIVLGLSRDLAPGASAAGIAQSIDWVAHGFEIVQSIYPGWRFQAADCIADGGLHGALHIGPRRPVAPGEAASLAERLAGLRLTLFRNGEEMDAGTGANALGGPLSALAHLVEVLAADPYNPPLRAGEIVTTGTLTRAFPIAPGETWSTRIQGFELDGLSVAIA